MRLHDRFWLTAVALTAASVASAQTAPRIDEQRDGPPPSSGPSGTSDRGPGRFDEVGYAAVATDAPARFVAKVRGVAAGGYVEVTMLDSGRTTLVQSDGEDAPIGTLAWLSPAAAAAIGLDGRAGVRVRRMAPAPADQTALANGRAPGPRLDAPPSLLAGLRVRLAGTPGKPFATTPTPRSAVTLPATVPSAQPAPVKLAPRAPPHPVPASRSAGLYVQLAAFGSADRANALARSIGGTVTPAGNLYRVRTGPYSTPAQAAQARDAAAARGYAGARVVRDN